MSTLSDRSKALNEWLIQLGYVDYSLTPASEDASFRSYLRLRMGDQSWIVMDAPPEREPCDQFIAIAEKLRAAKLSAPEVIAQNLQLGFLILTDFGGSDYLSLLNSQNEGPLYADALAAILQMQTRIDADDLPAYDENLLTRELDLFHDWFLLELLAIELNRAQQTTWQAVKNTLVENALEQPQLFVHRDFHSRNLMKIEQGNPGILDFQDAVKGPITYDLLSLLRDCYIDWPPIRVDQLLLEYYQLARANGLVDVSATQFKRWFNLMGIQRHLKAIGIFSRLKIRDGKSAYLKDIPRTLGYVCQVSAEEKSMAGLFSMLEELELSLRVNAMERE